MVVVVFTSRLRADANVEEYAELGNVMYSLAEQNPGFVSYSEYSSQDGETVALICFKTLDELEQWRTHPEHVKAQQAGRERFYASYSMKVCTTVRQYAYDVNTGRTVIE